MAAVVFVTVVDDDIAAVAAPVVAVPVVAVPVVAVLVVAVAVKVFRRR